jgi:hypothetical protein
MKYPSPEPPLKYSMNTTYEDSIPGTCKKSLHLRDGVWSAQYKKQDKESIHCSPQGKAGLCTNGCSNSYDTNLYFYLIQVLHMYINI